MTKPKHSALHSRGESAIATDSSEQSKPGLQTEQPHQSTNIAPNTLPLESSHERTSARPQVKSVLSADYLTSPDSGLVSPSSVSQASNSTKGLAGPSVINKQVLSKLNKTLKEKQKVINQKDSHLRNATLIQDVLSTLPQSTQMANVTGNSSSFANDSIASSENLQQEDSKDGDQKVASNGIPMKSVAGQSKETEQKSKPAFSKAKRIAKQASTKTDFFAAKLADAVYEIESSDSDETFVYETNADDFANEDVNSSTNNLTSVLPIHEENIRTSASTNTDNTDNNSPAVQLLNDNLSVTGSIRNHPLEARAMSPVEDQKKDDDTYPHAALLNTIGLRAESVHSLQSSKYNLRNTFNTTPPTMHNARHTSQAATASLSESHPFSDPYLDNSSRLEKHSMRKGSTNSILSDDRRNFSNRSSNSPLVDSASNLISNPVVFRDAEHGSQMSDNYNDGLYSYGDVDLSADDASSHDDMHLVCTSQNAVPNGHIAPKVNEDHVGTRKSRSKELSSTSSKLRSTTSKLFDKKGAQPRRYSTIPDDLDIEDYDDELIYYDNNTKFPFYNQHSGALNEQSPLLNGHRIPHHRSLNLNLNPKRASPSIKNKRYLSLGYVPPPSQMPLHKRASVFPFPFPDAGDPDYYDFNEYDEDSQMHLHQGHRSPNFVHGRGSPLQTQFTLGQHQNLVPYRRNSLGLLKSILYTFLGIFCILFIGFVAGFFLASTKDLTNVSVLNVLDAIVSQDELIFNVVVEAINPGWFTVSVEDIEIDLFAKSGYLDDDSTGLSVETVLLGTVMKFESALYFEGRFFDRQASQQTGEIRLLGPGKNLTSMRSAETEIAKPKANSEKSDLDRLPDNSEKWKIISQHPFDLILRGVLKYTLPLTANVKSVVINKVGYVDPHYSG